MAFLFGMSEAQLKAVLQMAGIYKAKGDSFEFKRDAFYEMLNLMSHETHGIEIDKCKIEEVSKTVTTRARKRSTNRKPYYFLFLGKSTAGRGWKKHVSNSHWK